MSATKGHSTYSVLSVKDRERLRRQIDMDKRRLQGEIVVPSMKNEGTPTRQLNKYQQFMDKGVQEDPGEIINRMRRYQNALKVGEPPPLTKGEKVKLENQVKKDKAWLQRTLTPKKLYFMRESNPDFETAVKAAMVERTPAFQQVAHRYKQAMRQLDTHTPDAASIEKLRPN